MFSVLCCACSLFCAVFFSVLYVAPCSQCSRAMLCSQCSLSCAVFFVLCCALSVLCVVQCSQCSLCCAVFSVFSVLCSVLTEYTTQQVTRGTLSTHTK